MSGIEFIQLIKAANEDSMEEKLAEDNDKYVYGIAGIAELFHCSLPTANRIKKSGRIKKAITQIGRKIIVDKKMALELAAQPIYHRRGACFYINSAINLFCCRIYIIFAPKKQRT